MKTFNFQQTHIDTAINLFKQRQIALAKPKIAISWLQNLEEKLLIHLQTLGYCTLALPLKNNSQAFVFFASQFSTLEKDNPNYQLSYKTILKNPNLKTGILAALSLFPSPNLQTELVELYQQCPQLRQNLWQFWHEIGAEIPIALLHQAEADHHDSQLAFNAITYAADSPYINLDFFQNYYSKLLQKKSLSFQQVWQPAIWGGMLRGDPEALIALRLAIELTTDEKQLDKLLYLAAISGDINFITILRQYAQRQPQSGIYLISRYGRKEIIPDILNALSNIQTAKIAALAWEWLFGNELPSKPRLTLINDPSITSVDEIPDSTIAHQHWQQQSQSHDRWLLGNALTVANLIERCQQWSGVMGKDLQTQLAYMLKKPLGCGINHWQLHRIKYLKSYLKRAMHEKSNLVAS